MTITPKQAKEIFERLEKLEDALLQFELLKERQGSGKPRKTSSEIDEEIKRNLLKTTYSRQ